MNQLAFWCGSVIISLLFGAWCCGAIYFQEWIRERRIKLLLMGVFALLSLTLAAGSFSYRYLLFLQLFLSAAVAVPWFLWMRPAGREDWQISCSRIPAAEFSPDGEFVTISGIRDFHYRSKEDFDAVYRQERYALKDLRTMDYVITHWGVEWIGHVMLSFGFADGRHLVFSGELRIGQSRKKTLLAGIYRQYEFICIIGTEEDLLQLRTHFRKDRVYLYPMNIDPGKLPAIFTDLVKRAADLGPHPRYYNTLLFNCTNSLAVTSVKFGSAFGAGLSGIINGLYGRSAFQTGTFGDRAADETFWEYRRRHLINRWVEGQTDLPDYSRRIRPWEKRTASAADRAP